MSGDKNEVSLVLTRLENGVGEITLNRPAQKNALTGPLVESLIEAIDLLSGDTACRVIILRGAGGCFCAGLDLKAFSQSPAPEWREHFTQTWTEFHRLVFECDKPIITAVERFAIAGGSSLAFAGDFLVMGEGAFIHVSEVERGMKAPLNVFWLSVRHSYQIALKMALLGQRQSAECLLAMGIAERVVADDDVLTSARGLANRLAELDGENLKAMKKSVKRAFNYENFDEVFARISN